MLRRVADRLRGRLDLPASLVWAELWGACHALPAYHATYRRDAALRAAARPARSGIQTEAIS